jgi:hypothetical protein
VNGNELVSSLQVQVQPETVKLVLHVTNFSGLPQRLDFNTGQRYDFEVYEQDRRLWRWSEGQMFTQALGHSEVGPGETVSFEERWPHEGRTGGFEAVGRVTATNLTVERRAEFRIP